MRTAHDWGRATGRPRTSAPVSHKSHYIRAILCAAAAALAACDNSGTNATGPASAPADPAGPTAPPGTEAAEATRTVVDGIAYPTVTIEPSEHVTMKVDETLKFTAHLRGVRGREWTSCCSHWASSDPRIVTVKESGFGDEAGEHAIVVAHHEGTATITATTESDTKGTLKVTVDGKSTSSDPSSSDGGSKSSDPSSSNGSSSGSSSNGSGSSNSGSKSGSGSSGSGSKSGSGSSSGTGSGSGGSGSKTPPSPSAAPSVGGTHEPGGMSTQINTGPITSTGIVTMFSPSATNSVGETSQNLSVVPGGTGLRLAYKPNLTAGYSPVRFGMPISSAGTGWYYQRMKVRFSSNWTNGGNPLIKLCEPRTQQMGSSSGDFENHVVGGFVNAGPTQSFLTVILQGPYGQSRDLFSQPAGSAQANLSDGNWHTIEVLFGPESSPGAGNGTYQGWVDGAQIASYSNVKWLGPGNQVGWPYLMFDPVYGGVQTSPPYDMWWEFDQLYVATR